VSKLLDLTFFASLPQYLAACLVLLFAEAVYVLFGFGVGLIAVGVLAMVMPEAIQDVVVLLLLTNLPAEVFVVTRSWRSIVWRGVLLICVGMAVGVPVGSAVLSWGRPDFVLVVLGGFLLLAGLAFLLLPARTSVRWPTWSSPVAGLLSGLLGGMFGTGGPPLIFYYRLSGLDKAAFRGNLMAIFLLVTLVRLPSYGVMGLITTERLWSALAVIPAVATGALLGHKIHLELEEVTFQRLVAVGLVLLGLLLLLRLGTGS
jgi:uncharacterized membrane protein YfcA